MAVIKETIVMPYMEMADKNSNENYTIPFLQHHPCPCLGSNYHFARFSISHPGLHRIVKSTFIMGNN